VTSTARAGPVAENCPRRRPPRGTRSSRGKVRVERRATGARVDPLGIEAFQPVAKADALGRQEAQGRVAHLEGAPAAFRNDEPLPARCVLLGLEGNTVHEDVLEGDRGRRQSGEAARRVVRGRALGRREPQGVVGRAVRDGLGATGALPAGKAVGGVIRGNPHDLGRPSAKATRSSRRALVTPWLPTATVRRVVLRI
jgi:hypothetical protein